jgi:hypothetical protein
MLIVLEYGSTEGATRMPQADTPCAIASIRARSVRELCGDQSRSLALASTAQQPSNRSSLGDLLSSAPRALDPCSDADDFFDFFDRVLFERGGRLVSIKRLLGIFPLQLFLHTQRVLEQDQEAPT